MFHVSWEKVGLFKECLGYVFKSYFKIIYESVILSSEELRSF